MELPSRARVDDPRVKFLLDSHPEFLERMAVIAESPDHSERFDLLVAAHTYGKCDEPGPLLALLERWLAEGTEV